MVASVGHDHLVVRVRAQAPWEGEELRFWEAEVVGSFVVTMRGYGSGACYTYRAPAGWRMDTEVYLPLRALSRLDGLRGQERV